MDAAAAGLSPTQRHVLITLKRHGEATADELAAALGISASAVRQHLSALRSAGLIIARQDRGHTGRPADRYRATESAEPLFVTTADDLAVDLLGHLEEEDPSLVDRLFERRRQRLVEQARGELDGRSFEERVAALTDLLDAQGFLADHETLGPGLFRINLHTCPVWAVANRYRQACAAELGFIRDLLPGSTVERVSHKTAGAHSCTYEISVPAEALPVHR